jgi:hypothetical protein
VKAGLFGGIRKGAGGASTAGRNQGDVAGSAPHAAGTAREETAAAPAATASHVVSPVVARMFRRAPAGVAKSPTTTKEGVEGSPVPSGRTEPTRELRTFASVKRDTTSAPASQADGPNDEVFRKRLAIQRASNIWTPLIVAWFEASGTSRGAWSLPDLMTAIRADAKGMAETGLAAGDDERTVLSLTGMLAKAVACELRTASRDDRFLREDAVKEACAALRGILDEPPAAIFREASSDGVHVRGRTSLAISTADIAARLLPLIGRHAGLAAGEVLETVLDKIRQRSEHLVAGVLPDTATERDRQSLTQSLMRREAEVMASCLEGLPPAGTGSLGHGRAPFDRVMERYRRLSAALAQEVERITGHVHVSVNIDSQPPNPG